ncbi:unnamed protein product [Mucor hiemalis]
MSAVLQYQYRLPTRQNVLKVLKNFEAKEGLIYLTGQVITERDDTDVEQPFRQESNFFYVTGVAEPDFQLVINIATKKTHLIAPNVNPDHVMWMGMPNSLETLIAKYDVDEVVYADKLENILSAASIVYTLPINKKENVDASKAQWEVDIIREANRISSYAHNKLMVAAHVGSSESKLFAKFLYECAFHDSFQQAYYPIVGVGMNAATLHYNKNNAPLTNANDLILVDAGCEVDCYASDITRCFPVGGKFTPEARTIYTIVLDMQKACLAACKAGTPWETIHRIAVDVATDGLLACGILVGDKKEILANHVTAAFFPHGIGHMLGLDVHDLGGYPEGTERIDEPGIRNLRMRRDLQAGFVVTVEPGVYFCDFLIDPVLNDANTGKFINKEALNKYKSVGGVRIEDNIFITEDGHINLTTAPKEIAQIEAMCANEL